MRGFASLRGDPKPEYDAVVIGAGINGLAAAVHLSFAGHDGQEVEALALRVGLTRLLFAGP